jgi:imidazolonepropionase-like amidohydrolase
LIDADDAPLRRHTLLIHDGKILGVERGFLEDEDATTIDLSDHFVMPGMIDSHVHLRGEWSPTNRLDTVTKEAGDVAYDAASNARKTLMAGFTAVQDVGGPPEIFALKRAINSGKVPGPHIRASGSAISVSGGHGDADGYRRDVLKIFASETVCDGVADCRRAVRTAVKRDADLIKITATGGVLSNTNAGTGQQFFDDELNAIMQTAATMGRKVTAHAHGRDGIEAAIRAGVNSIEHGTYMDVGTARMMKENDVVLVPTVLAGMTVVDWATNYDFLPPNSARKALQVGPRMQQMLTIAYENDVIIAFGTDTGVSRHGQNAQEFRYMKAAGMSGKDMLASATKVASEHIEMADKIGTLEAGKHADIIAVDGNPLRDITELEDVDFVMKGGVVYKQEE